MKKNVQFIILLLFLHFNINTSGQKNFIQENNIEFSIIIDEKGNFTPDGKLSIQFINGTGIIYLYGRLDLNKQLFPFRVGFLNFEQANDIYYELKEYIYDDFQYIGQFMVDSTEGTLKIRRIQIDKKEIKKTISYFSNYHYDRFNLFYGSILSLAIQNSEIPKINDYYINNGIKTQLENFISTNKSFEGLEFISNYIDNFNKIKLNQLDLKSVVNIFANKNIPFDIKENVYNVWCKNNKNKEGILSEIQDYFFTNIGYYSQSAKQEIFSFINKYGNKKVLKKLCNDIISTKDLEMASIALENENCQKYLKNIFQEFFLNNINSPDNNISLTCIQSLDKYYNDYNFLNVFYNLLQENINKYKENQDQKKIICALFKAIDKYYNIKSNYLCCVNTVPCTKDEIFRLFSGIESRLFSK